MMNKIFSLVSLSKSLFKQSQDKFSVKINFLFSITSHYFFKIFGIKITSFPEMNILVENCKFKTRKNVMDFWVVSKDYEKEIFQDIEKRIKDYSFFIDVGANIGRYSIIMAKKGLNVYAFEPIKDNFLSLKENARINHLMNKIKFYNMGLGQKECTKNIFYEEYKSAEASLNKKEESNEIIKLFPLDKIIKSKLKGKAILKIDVEGSEYDVLLGAEKFIKLNKPAIIVEIWDKKVESFLSNLGFKKNGEIWDYSLIMKNSPFKEGE